MSISNLLHEIITLDRETAISELSILKQNISASEFRAAVKLLPSYLKPTLSDISTSEVNRRKLPSYEGFKLGDRVQMKSNTLARRQVNRGRLRQPQPRRRVLERRIGQSRQPIGWATSKGSKRIFYVHRANLDRVLEVSSICPYPSLLGVELTISEFTPPWVCCLLPSGSNAPGLLVEDLEIIKETNHV